MKSEKRKKMFSQKKAAKENRMKRSGAKSNYGKKNAFLHAHGGWGFDYTDKPWK